MSRVQKEVPRKRYNESHQSADDILSNELIKTMNLEAKRRGPRSEHRIPPVLKS